MKYDIELLNKYCLNNNLKLTKEYTKINRENLIEGICQTDRCNSIFSKKFRQLIITGGYCQECMKIITSNKIKKSLVTFNEKLLTEFCVDNDIHLIHNINTKQLNRNSIIEGKCKTLDCNNNFKKSFRELIKINGYCSYCSKENGKLKIKQTNQLKYGVDCCLQSPIIRNKIETTNIAKYNSKCSLQDINIQSKIKENNLIKYGVEYVLQSPSIRNKIEQTNIIKYGCKNPQQNEEIKQKNKEIILNKYGKDNYFKTDDFRNKIKNIYLKKYGVVHHSQCPEIAEKMLSKSSKLKEYLMPSGKKVKFQGYENYAYDELLYNLHILENDIITKRTEVPSLWYYDNTNKLRRHYVDIFISSLNKCIEVKSEWTKNLKGGYVFEKQESAKNNGYFYEIWVYNNKGNLIEKII